MKEFILQKIDEILNPLMSSPLFMMVRPILNLARPALIKEIEENPEEVKIWIKTANEKLTEILEFIEND